MSATMDVFVSYAHADQAWVHTLAENLHQAGLEVFYDEWQIDAGDVLVHKLDEGILSSRSGIIVVSPTALSRPWVQQEYAAMMTRAVAGEQRLIPVILEDAELPPLLAARVWIDFRGADGPLYTQRVQELVRALKGERKGPPPRTGELKPPPGTGFRPEGKVPARLVIGTDEVVLRCGKEEVRGPVAGLDAGFEQLLWEQRRAHRLGIPSRDDEGRGIEPILEELGRRLGEAFLPAPVAERLGAEIAQAAQGNATLELALEIPEALADLPFEALRPPGVMGQALALQPRLDLYRHVTLEGPATGIAIPGPLRILVAIGSPEAQNARGELLDMEAELARILDATDRARRDGKAFVRILERGSVAAIDDALREQRYHVLYVSCHATPGRLILEDADGKADEVDVDRFWAEALPADRGVPLVILAGCSTARAELPAGDENAEPLPGFARGLVARGMPAVIAMQATVSDRYATALAGEMLGALATWQESAPLKALAVARRALERARLADASPNQLPPEWATPAFYASAGPLPLFDPSAPFEDVAQPPEPVLDKGVVVRRVGDFVGRRREERLMLRALRGDDGAGVVLHGIGGVGKSSLAANALHRLAGDGWLVASLFGVVDNDRLLDELGARLLDHCRALKLAEDHERRQIANDLRVPNTAWEERLDQLIRHVLPQVPLVFLLDNFEDNLGAGRRVEGDLGELLANWIARPGRSQLLFTTRHPFELPDDAAEALVPLPLGPLSLAETRKLALRLEGLAELAPEERARAYEEVGGHPRALEYLDALLRGGKARFAEVERRLKQALAKQGVDDPAGWRKAHAGKLDLAMADTVTLAANDVLLDDLLAELDAQPLAKQLLFGAAVYREPVDRTGLAWQVSHQDRLERSDDPDRQSRMRRVQQALQQAQASGQELAFNSLGSAAEAFGLAEADLARYEHDLAEMRRPPIDEPEGLDGAVARLQALSLLSLVQYADEEAPRFLVHRWTAGALSRRATADALAEAHRRAAGYWRWRVKTQPQSKQQDIADLLEARHHHHAAGDLDKAVEATEWACTQLDTWAAWQWEERLCHETLGWLPERSQKAAVFVHTLGNLAYRRGEYDQALGWYRKSLEIQEALGDRAGMASPYHQLGNVAYLKGDYDQALGWYRKSLEIAEALGDRASMANSYHQLGMVAEDRGEYDQALGWYRKSLEIEEALGNRAGMAGSYHQLGVVAQRRGEYDQALDWYRKALEIDEALGDRAGMARSYHQLGRVAEQRGAYDQALGWYRKSLEIAEALGDRAGMASTISQIGVLSTERGDAEGAVPLNLRSLAIRMEIGAPIEINIHWLGRQREALGEARFGEILRQHVDEGSVPTLLELMEQYAAAQEEASEPSEPAASGDPGEQAQPQQPGLLGRVRAWLGGGG